MISLAADLQDPPELIPEFLKKWEEGFKVALGMKAGGEESWPMSWVRDGYYRLLARLSDVEPVRNSTGFGLCDRQVVEIIRDMNDPYPYFRGLLPRDRVSHRPDRVRQASAQARQDQEQFLHSL